MAKPTNLPCLPLWQPIRIEQNVAPQCFAVEVGSNDFDVGMFIAEGYYDVPRPPKHRGTRTAMRASDGILRKGLWGHLSLSLLDLGEFKRDPQAANIRVYCHRVHAAPGGRRLCLLCSLEPLPPKERPLPADVFAIVVEAAARHQSALATYAVDVVMRKAQDEKFMNSVPHDQRAVFQKTQSLQIVQPKPVFDITPLATAFPPGLMVKLSSTDPDSTEHLAQRVVAQHPDDKNPPPRDGWYETVFASLNPKQHRALVTWQPHRGLPAYPEIRAAASRRLPRAFLSPPLFAVDPPEIDGELMVAMSKKLTPVPFDPSSVDWLNNEDFSFGFDFPRDVAREAKGRLQKFGFECIGWYQPHHIYSEETWGIYIDAPRLDKTACSIAEDLRTDGMRRPTNALAAKLALMLVYQHELFHAKVEAALTWVELQSLQPKFRRYQTQVYNALKGTDDHLEEALANFSAWAWLSADAVVAQLTGKLNHDERQIVERVVRYHLDLSPPGYRRWPDGHRTAPWRTLATQMAQGTPNLSSSGHGLPIESMLREPLPFDYRPWDDVPCRFVGSGRIASAMFAAPATLNLPQRQEIRKVIQRHFSYELIKGAGKGSHEKFRHADGRMFSLPQRDPVSMTVFKNFLSHFELRKHDYDQIRHMV